MIKIGKNISSFSTYSYKPESKEELDKIINSKIEKEGLNCNLNDIDTSLITDMSWLFYESDFNGNISNWNTSKVTSMREMFAYSKFNKDISNWQINKNCNTSNMFTDCPIREEYKPELSE